ncbi:hypothetical protein HK099_007768, partial [Clydaea vesicula]
MEDFTFSNKWANYINYNLQTNHSVPKSLMSIDSQRTIVSDNANICKIPGFVNLKSDSESADQVIDDQVLYKDSSFDRDETRSLTESEIDFNFHNQVEVAKNESLIKNFSQDFQWESINTRHNNNLNDQRFMNQKNKSNVKLNDLVASNIDADDNNQPQIMQSNLQSTPDERSQYELGNQQSINYLIPQNTSCQSNGCGKSYTEYFNIQNIVYNNTVTEPIKTKPLFVQFDKSEKNYQCQNNVTFVSDGQLGILSNPTELMNRQRIISAAEIFNQPPNIGKENYGKYYPSMIGKSTPANYNIDDSMEFKSGIFYNKNSFIQDELSNQNSVIESMEHFKQFPPNGSFLNKFDSNEANTLNILQQDQRHLENYFNKSKHLRQDECHNLAQGEEAFLKEKQYQADTIKQLRDLVKNSKTEINLLKKKNLNLVKDFNFENINESEDENDVIDDEIFKFFKVSNDYKNLKKNSNNLKQNFEVFFNLIKKNVN